MLVRTRTGLRNAAATGAAALADLLWPLRCAGCDLPGAALCEQCRAALRPIDRADACPVCGAPDGAAGCAECGRDTHVFASARCAGVFEWPLSRAITLHKDAGELRFTALLAGFAADAAGDWLEWADVVVGVPASPGAQSRRGFDHGALLAAALSVHAGVPAAECLRCRPRGDQRRLSRGGRAANAGSSIVALAGVYVPARVLLDWRFQRMRLEADGWSAAVAEGIAAHWLVSIISRAIAGPTT